MTKRVLSKEFMIQEGLKDMRGYPRYYTPISDKDLLDAAYAASPSAATEWARNPQSGYAEMFGPRVLWLCSGSNNLGGDRHTVDSTALRVGEATAASCSIADCVDVDHLDSAIGYRLDTVDSFTITSPYEGATLGAQRLYDGGFGVRVTLNITSDDPYLAARQDWEGFQYERIHRLVGSGVLGLPDISDILAWSPNDFDDVLARHAQAS